MREFLDALLFLASTAAGLLLWWMIIEAVDRANRRWGKRG